MRSFTVTMNPSRNVTLEAVCFDPPSPDEQPTPLEHPRPAIVICPGGSYRFLSQREADPVAVAYLAYGFDVFILRYSIREHARGLAPAIDAARAVRWVRAHAEELGVDPERVAILGFSAGGHVAAQLATHWQDEDLVAAERAEYAGLRFLGLAANEGLMDHSSRPDALIASYAVLGTGWKNDGDPALTYLDLYDAVTTLRELPGLAGGILHRLNEGNLRTRIAIEDLRNIENRLDRLNSQLPLGLLASSVLLSGTLFLVLGKEADNLATVALGAYVLAGVLGLWFLWPHRK